MSYKGKHFRNLPKKSTPQDKMEIEHITSVPMCYTDPVKRYPATNLGIPSDEGVEGGRHFDEENVQ